VTQPADVSSEQRNIERALVFHLLDDEHNPRWSRAELVAALGDPEPAIETALARLQEHGVALGEGDAILASPCAQRLDALRVIAI
jgi:2-keto-4-pentenoate hydratase